MRYTNPRNTHSLNRITAMTSNDTSDIRFDVNYAIKSNKMAWALGSRTKHSIVPGSRTLQILSIVLLVKVNASSLDDGSDPCH